MTLQYLGHKSGEIFEPTPGTRQSYSLSNNAIIQTLEYTSNASQTGEKSYLRYTYTGSFKFNSYELTEASISDVSLSLWSPLGGETAWSLHFDTPLKLKPHELTDLNRASRVNYSYRETGDERPSGNPLLENQPVTNNRSTISAYSWAPAIDYGWWNSPFNGTGNSSPSAFTGTAKQADIFTLTGPTGYGTGYADHITNFNPKEKDRLQINITDFGSSAGKTFSATKNTKALTKALASKTDFIYLKTTGELYYNEDVTVSGFGGGGVFAILENKPPLTAQNIEFP